MQVLVYSDNHISGTESVTERVESIVHGSLDRFGGRITRVEVHLSDVNGAKPGDRDKRCVMEARLAGLKPVAVSHQAPTLLEAIEAAADKLERAIGRLVGKLEATSGRSDDKRSIATVDELEQLEKAGNDRDPSRS